MVLAVELLGAIRVGEDGRGLGLLLEVLNVCGGVAPLERGQVAGAPMLALPEEVLPQRLRQLCGEHVAAGCAG